MSRGPPGSTRSATLLPSTTLFLSMITKIVKRQRVGFGVFLGLQVTDEVRLTAKNGLDRLTGLNRADVDFRRGQCEHVSARVHLVHQRRNDRDGADAGETHCRNIDEVTTADTGFTGIFRRFTLIKRCHSTALVPCSFSQVR